MRRREFLKTTGLLASATACAPRWSRAADLPGTQPERPNVLWISVEDISPDLGCYGDTYAVTPNLDAFAAQGTRFDSCFAHMGVCAPARSGIISAMYPTCIGTNHMRCRGVPQPEVRCFTEYLRAAGYYCSNHSKTDYQFNPPATAWDVQGGSKWWRGRAENQPFFTVINLGTTHESQIRNAKRRQQADEQLTPEELHDPAKANIPAYHPDTPVVRKDWAQYADNITLMDKEVARILGELAKDGLAENTIVWFWGDHGRGLPRGKRWIYDSGSHAPLIVRVPKTLRHRASPGDALAFRPNTATDELVQFIDFGPTVLSLCGVDVPKHMQGQPFMGPQKAVPRRYIYGARDRVDEANDTIRCVRDGRFKYIRNFQPHLPRSLDVDYMNKMPTMQEMRRLHAEGKLKGPELQYFECPKAIEELYDIKADPHEVRNLADVPAHGATLGRLRDELFAWMRQTGDFGMLPEPEFDALKRPNDQYETTAAPGVTPTQVGGETRAALVCATAGASITYRVGKAASSGATGITLLGTKAKMNGPKPWPGKDRTNLQAWRNSRAWVSWNVKVPRPGKLPVHVIWGCAGNASSKFIVEVAGQALEGCAENTGGWDEFKVARLGDITIAKAGSYAVTLKPEEKEGAFQMDLQAVVIGGENIKPLTGSTTAGPWKLYTQPVPVDPGQQLEAKACRLGFKDSPAVTYRHGGPGIAAQTAEARAHWRASVDRSGLVNRVLDLKLKDGTGKPALDAYATALDDPAASVRWWAVLGIHHGHDRSPVKARTRQETIPYLTRFRALLEDDSACVRVAAAQALCDWGEEAAGLPTLLDVLQNAATASGKHFAATALNQIGMKARPGIETIKTARKAGGYTNRMCSHLLRRLER